jgi:hypothetical protein
MTQVKTAMAGTDVRPFRIDLPEGDLLDLRQRILATRWPESETVADQSQGVQLATIQELAENKLGFFDVKGVTAPAAVSVFPRELYQAPRSWTERAYPNLIYFNEVDQGNHFAAWQEPELFTTEVRAAFRSLR